VNQKTVVIIGKSGQLASELLSTAPTIYRVFALGRHEINLASEKDMAVILDRHKPDIIINTAAFTQVDKAEIEVDTAFAINFTAVEFLARYCKKRSIGFLQVSTDFVFDGKAVAQYRVDTPTSAIGIYGQSKAAGEETLLAEYPENSSIIRTSWLYSEFGSNFVKTMLHLMEQKDELKIVADQVGTPTWAKGLALFLWRLCEVDNRDSIFHWSDAGETTWYDFALKIKELATQMLLITNDPQITPTTAKEYAAPAPRPAYSVLDCSRSYAILAANSWEQQLSSMLSKLASEQGTK
jgi:dTDP-4-dehydrorhamnose reductase